MKRIYSVYVINSYIRKEEIKEMLVTKQRVGGKINIKVQWNEVVK